MIKLCDFVNERITFSFYVFEMHHYIKWNMIILRGPGGCRASEIKNYGYLQTCGKWTMINLFTVGNNQNSPTLPSKKGR